jgi:hypothetical protein
MGAEDGGSLDKVEEEVVGLLDSLRLLGLRLNLTLGPLVLTLGDLDGFTDGLREGREDSGFADGTAKGCGTDDGFTLVITGLADGADDGFTLVITGLADGADDGFTLVITGVADGADDGFTLVITGAADGADDGFTLVITGAADGADDGFTLVITGVADGADDGFTLVITGVADGSDDGFTLVITGVADGSDDGIATGVDVGGSDGTGMPATDNIYLLKRLKSRDPNPDAGSQPGEALNPSLQHIDEAVQLFLPLIISFVKVFALAYRSGLRKPIGLPPFLRRATLTKDRMPAITGDDTEVPAALKSSPPS